MLESSLHSCAGPLRHCITQQVAACCPAAASNAFRKYCSRKLASGTYSPCCLFTPGCRSSPASSRAQSPGYNRPWAQSEWRLCSRNPASAACCWCHHHNLGAAYCAAHLCPHVQKDQRTPLTMVSCALPLRCALPLLLPMCVATALRRDAATAATPQQCPTQAALRPNRVRAAAPGPPAAGSILPWQQQQGQQPGAQHAGTLQHWRRLCCQHAQGQQQRQGLCSVAWRPSAALLGR